MKNDLDRWIELAFSQLDMKELEKLTTDLINIPSRTGEEEECALYVLDTMRRLRFEVSYQRVGEKRGNAIGSVLGEKEGKSLLFNGHLDTSFTGIEKEDYPMTGPHLPDYKPFARVENGVIHGLGAYNMKGAVACSIMAANIIKKSGAPFKGKIIVTAVSGEIEKCQVSTLFKDYIGPLYQGAAIGTEYLVKHGVTCDYALVGEPTGCQVSWENTGYAWFKIGVKGYLTHTASKPAGINAILKAAKAAEAIDEWSKNYSNRNETEMTHPEVSIGAIESGWPYKPTYSPALCNLYVDVRMNSKQKAMDVEKELRQVLENLKKKEAPFDYTLEMYMSNQGAMTPPDSLLIQTCMNAYERVMKKPHGKTPKKRSGFWADSNIFRRLGVPAATWGPGGGEFHITPQGQELGESIALKELEVITKMYVVASLMLLL